MLVLVVVLSDACNGSGCGCSWLMVVFTGNSVSVVGVSVVGVAV
jgi:hypothetical protein